MIVDLRYLIALILAVIAVGRLSLADPLIPSIVTGSFGPLTLISRFLQGFRGFLFVFHFLRSPEGVRRPSTSFPGSLTRNERFDRESRIFPSVAWFLRHENR